MFNIPENYFKEIAVITYDDYFKNNPFSADIFRRKYAISDEEKIHPARVYKRVVDAIASKEVTEKLQKYWSNRWLWEIWNDWWVPAGSIMEGAGNTAKISLSNCTTIEIKDDTLESIFETGQKIAKAAAYRQGLGVDISKLRPKNAKINNSAKYSHDGSIGWMKWFDNIGSHVGQRGRIPAMLFSINVSHPDVLDFITAKSNLHAIQNANISIQITDDFMHAVENNIEWELNFYIKDNNEKISSKILAQDLLQKLAEEANTFAEPGVQFIDTCKRESVTDVLGYPIKSTNACSEKFMYPDSTCVLAPINVGKFSTKKYKQELELICPSITRFLDNVVSYELSENKVPYKNQATIITKLREIGVGITNLHKWLFDQNLAYDSNDGIEKTEDFLKTMSFYCWKTSIDLGKEKGNCQAFDELKNKADIYNSDFIKRISTEFSDLVFDSLRCSQVLSIAPTGSASLQFSDPVISYGIEPSIGLYYWKRERTAGKWNWYFVVPNFVRQYLKLHSISLPFEGESILDNSGEIGE